MLDAIPDHTRDALKDYIERGVPVIRWIQEHPERSNVIKLT